MKPATVADGGRAAYIILETAAISRPFRRIRFEAEIFGGAAYEPTRPRSAVVSCSLLVASCGGGAARQIPTACDASLPLTVRFQGLHGLGHAT